jgi:hypothetical protein
MKKENASLGTEMDKFLLALSEIALSQQNTINLLEKYGDLYRWKWQYEKDIAMDGHWCPVTEYKHQIDEDLRASNNSVLSEGWRWMMELKANGRWWNWVYIQQTKHSDGTLGVFAARDFPRGSLIGFHLPNHGNSENMKSIREENQPYLYMGMHYIKSGCNPIKYGSSYIKSGGNRQNCYRKEDGSIMALRKIVKDTELLFAYNGETIAESA